jgi:hypothetical protein
MNFKIGEIHKNTPYLFADLAELILLVGYNGRKSLHKNDLESVISTNTISAEELDYEEQASIDSDDLSEVDAEKNDRLERQLEDVLTQIDYRTKALDLYYPFIVDGELIRLKTDLTNKQRVYKFLLACSRLRSFPEVGIAQHWAKAFTELSKIAMQGLLPNNAEVRIFDANSSDRAMHYTHSLDEALKRLGKDLAVEVHEANCNKAGKSGDAGLDLVAFINFDDGAKTTYAIMGQCGAQETGWPKKTLEAHSMRYRGYYQILFDYPGVMFTPVCYRTADGEWWDIQAASGVLLIDRIRILKLIGFQDKWDEIVSQCWFKAFEDKLNTITAPD